MDADALALGRQIMARLEPTARGYRALVVLAIGLSLACLSAGAVALLHVAEQANASSGAAWDAARAQTLEGPAGDDAVELRLTTPSTRTGDARAFAFDHLETADAVHEALAEYRAERAKNGAQR